MANDWLTHKQLQIVRGVGKTAGDRYSAENDPIVINLMGGIFSLDTWTPNIPAVKSGGVWSDSPVSDGRQLLSAPLANVTEQISVVLTSSAYNLVQRELSRLNSMALDCRDFWQTETQIDPVYLLWYASVGAGPQYALIYDIQISPEYLPSPQPTIRVSITIEREPAWRGIPPGANPKMWSNYVNSANPVWDVSRANLYTADTYDSTQLISEPIVNSFSWSPATYGNQLYPLNNAQKNYVEIPASKVPGDVPALLEVFMYTTSAWGNVFMGLTSKKMSGTDHLGTSRAGSLNFPAGDGNSAGVVTKTVSAGPPSLWSNGSSTNKYYGERTATGIDANYVTACGWGGPTGANGIQVDRQFLRGTYAVFVRANNNSGTPTLADMKMRVLFEEFEDAGGTEYISTFYTQPQQVPLTVSNAGASVTYMGIVTLPLSTKAVQSIIGYGVQLQETTSNLRISLQLKYDVATANRIFRVVDLFLLPVDEGLMEMVVSSVPSSVVNEIIFDNTGYLTRGVSRQVAVSWVSTRESGGTSQEVRGQPVMLKPNTAQRLYFLGTTLPATGREAMPTASVNVHMNIVPRWMGIRDA